MMVDALLQHVQVLNVHPCIALIYVGNTTTLCALSCSTLSEKRYVRWLTHSNHIPLQRKMRLRKHREHHRQYTSFSTNLCNNYKHDWRRSAASYRDRLTIVISLFTVQGTSNGDIGMVDTRYTDILMPSGLRVIVNLYIVVLFDRVQLIHHVSYDDIAMIIAPFSFNSRHCG